MLDSECGGSVAFKFGIHFTPDMNLVLEDVEEVTQKDEKIPIGTIMMRGNSIVLWECLDKIS